MEFIILYHSKTDATKVRNRIIRLGRDEETVKKNYLRENPNAVINYITLQL